MSLRTSQKRMTRSLLLRAGLEAFLEKGYVGSTIDDIAARAGANRATFYLHFASKDQLVLGLIDEIDDQVANSDNPRLTKVAESGDPGEFRVWLQRRFDQWPTIMPYVTVAARSAESEPAILEAINKWWQQPIDEIRTGLDLAGRFPPESRYVRGVLAFGQVEFLSRRWALEGWGNEMDRDSALDALVETWTCLLSDRD
jgi:AcrR family transcriptional regulator